MDCLNGCELVVWMWIGRVGCELVGFTMLRHVFFFRAQAVCNRAVKSWFWFGLVWVVWCVVAWFGMVWYYGFV